MRPSAPARPARAPRACRRFAQDRRGASALEFALVAPVFIMLLVGTVEVAITLNRMMSVQWAVESAARRAMIDGQVSQTELQALVDDLLTYHGGSSDVDIAYQVDNSGPKRIAHITANYTHGIHIPMASTFDAQLSVDTYVPLVDADEEPVA